MSIWVLDWGYDGLYDSLFFLTEDAAIKYIKALPYRDVRPRELKLYKET